MPGRWIGASEMMRDTFSPFSYPEIHYTDQSIFCPKARVRCIKKMEARGRVYRNPRRIVKKIHENCLVKNSGILSHRENPRNCHDSLPSRPLKSEVVNFIFTARTEMTKVRAGAVWDFSSTLFTALLHLPPLRFHCVRGCWGRTQDCCEFGI
jgi:hypothetical protein